MSKKRLTGGGSDVMFFDPEPSDACEYRCQQKKGGRWCSDACGDPAVTIFAIGRHEPTEFGGKYLGSEERLTLCRKHLRRVIDEFISALETS